MTVHDLAVLVACISGAIALGGILLLVWGRDYY